MSQLERVKNVMLDGKWHTINDLRWATNDPESSISARLRDLRKSRYGGYNVERARISNFRNPVVFAYRFGKKSSQKCF